jgi:ribokinase
MQRHDPEVLVMGSLHLDIVVRARSLPALDETALGSSWQMVCGGKGGNQACWASRSGARTAMISRVGHDEFGRRLVDNLVRSGVDVSAVSVDPQVGSGMSVAILQDDGNYGAVIVSGSNLKLAAADVEQSFRSMTMTRIVLLQNEVEEQVNIAAAFHAKRQGGRVVLNAAPARPLPLELATMVDVLVVNRIEAGMMSKYAVASPEDAKQVLPDLMDSYPAVVITLGSVGVVVGERGRRPEFIPAEKVVAVSTHGAGDCFIGQMAAAMAQGLLLQEACRLANSRAAAFVAGRLSMVQE